MKPIEEYEIKRREQLSKARSVVDYTMGLLFTAVAIYLLFFDKRDWDFFDTPPRTGNYVLGAMFLIYGGWRIYRGYRKKYFKD